MDTSCCYLAALHEHSPVLLHASLKLALRSMLREEPIMIHMRGGGMKKIGGPEQCSQFILRSVLARLNNWTMLVKEVVKAELPWFEAFSSLCTLLQLDARPAEFDRAAKNMASLLSLPAAALQHLSHHEVSMCATRMFKGDQIQGEPAT